MCLSTVYEERDGRQEKICEFVSGIRADAGRVTLTDIMGNETVVDGKLKTLDFVKNIIIIEGKDGGK